MDHEPKHPTGNEKPKIELDELYWDSRWQEGQTGWDIGGPSPAIAAYMAQYPNKNARILIPGCGNAHEAEYLLAQGFSDITLLDFAPKAVEILKEKFAAHPEIKVICADFFQHNGTYDLIIEQTFFCAIPPAMRPEYAKKAADLLGKNGKIAGLMFNVDFPTDGPPFGGNANEYRNIFDP